MIMDEDKDSDLKQKLLSEIIDHLALLSGKKPDLMGADDEESMEGSPKDKLEIMAVAKGKPGLDDDDGDEAMDPMQALLEKKKNRLGGF